MIICWFQRGKFMEGTIMYVRSILIYLVAIASISEGAEDEYRLPEYYKLSSYSIDLVLTPEAFTEARNEFSGRVTINFTFTDLTDYVALHAKPDYITLEKITFNNTEVSNENYAVNNLTDILTIQLQKQVTIGTSYSLVIDYRGVLSTENMYGFYKSRYVDEDGTGRYLATTFFSPTYARRAFPCFDEPAFKATFDISITFPTGLTALSNGQQVNSTSNVTTGLTTVTFETTTRMSTFIVAFMVSNFTCTTGASIGVPYRVCSRNASAPARDFAVDIGSKVLASLNNFTNYDYAYSASKLDQVAIPDFAAGAMENWGLVTYRETTLLWDKNESSVNYKQSAATVISHELAHQWFGNLVTMRWWSAVFLKEGFARYFQYYTTHEILPSWELDKQFVIENLHSALLTDALENSQALQAPCSTQAEISARFGTISYSKGGSIIRMVQHLMELGNFKTGLRNYLTTYAYDNVDPEDLWRVLNDSVVYSVSHLPADFLAVMDNWINKPGFPLLTVSVHGNEITISQKRFLLSGDEGDTKWYVPISYSTSLDSSKFQKTTPDTWLVPNEDLKIQFPENIRWIILNNQQTGYYRVNYDDLMWDNIKSALLKDNFDGIIDLNRAQIVDDVFNLARANHIKYSEVFDIVEFLANDTSYFPWYAAFNGYNFLLRRVGESSRLGRAISSNILDLMNELYDSVPISLLNEDAQIYTLKQILTLEWACKLGNEKCIEVVQGIFNRYTATGVRPDKNIRSVVYCNALRHSDNISDWDFLWEAYSNANDLATEQVTILVALGCTKNQDLLAEYLNKSISEGSGIRSQDALSVFGSVYSGNPEGVEVAFEFLMKNHEAIARKYNSMNSLGNLIRGIAERFSTVNQVTRLRSFIEEGNLPEAFRIAANAALETAEANLKWLEDFEGDLLAYYELNGARELKTSLLLFVTGFVSLVCIN